MTSTKLIRSATAAALALPFSLVAVVGPGAEAAPAAMVADRRGPFPPHYSPYAQYSSYSGLNTSVASTSESSGLVEISTVLSYGEGEAAGTGSS